MNSFENTLTDELAHVYAVDVAKQHIKEGAKLYKRFIQDDLEKVQRVLIELAGAAGPIELERITSLTSLPIFDDIDLDMSQLVPLEGITSEDLKWKFRVCY